MSEITFLSKEESECINFNEITIRILDTPKEIKRFNDVITQCHYLKSCSLVGEQIRYVVEHDGRWIALSAWCAAARYLKHRDNWIGWNRDQCTNRISLIANNSRYLLLTQPGYCPNLGSHVLAKISNRLSSDWEAKYNHPLLAVESFVDPQIFQGTVYKASGWIQLGHTSGSKRVQKDYYERHDRPKLLWVKALEKESLSTLRSSKLPETCSMVEGSRVYYCKESVSELKTIFDFVQNIPDWRSHQRNYSSVALVSLMVSAALCGISSGQRDLAAFAQYLSEDQMNALGFKKVDVKGKLLRPKETTFQRALSEIDIDKLQDALLTLQSHLLGKEEPGGLVGFDGKALRGGKSGLQTLNFFSTEKGGRWLGSAMIDEKTNEIPVSQEWISNQKIDLKNKVVMADALNTQRKTAQSIVQDAGADYVFVAKENQPKLKKYIDTQCSETKDSDPTLFLSKELKKQ